MPTLTISKKSIISMFKHISSFFGTSLKSNLQNKSCIHLDSFSTPTLLKTQRAQTINVSEMPLHVLRLTFRSNISTYIHTYIQCGCYIDMGKKSVL